jgi:hypothetical protein
MAKVRVINGVTYVEVDRSAEVGEKVLIVNAEYAFGKYRNGDILDAHRESFDGGIENDLVASPDGNKDGYIEREEYVVLEPVVEREVTVDTSQASEQVSASVDESQASPAVVNMFAALSRKIVSLESQLRDTQRNVEKFAEQTESNSEDIRTLDERTHYRTIAKEMARRLSR